MDHRVAAEPPVQLAGPGAASSPGEEAAARSDHDGGGARDVWALRGEIARLIVSLDTRIGEQLDRILHHPRFQALEARWRGVAWLNESMTGDPQLKLRIMDVRWTELERDFERTAVFDQTVLFEKVYNGEFGRPGGEPFGLLVVDSHVSHRPDSRGTDDLTVLGGLAEVAAAAFCPVVVGADARILGLDSYDEIDLRQEAGAIFQTAEYSRFQKLRSEPDARFIACALPRLLMRRPYQSRSFPRLGFGYNERIDEHRHLLWGSAAFGLASVAARAMKVHRWPANIRGAVAPNDGGIVNGPERLFLESDKPGVVARFPTEAAISQSQEVELNQLGLTALRQCHLTGSAAFFNVPSLHRPPHYESEVARVNARISANLHYVLCVSRFAHYIKVIAREWIGRFRTADEARRLLENWIQEYVTTTEDASHEQRAQYPLGEASIEVSERPDSPGSFDATVLLRPHFQLDNIAPEFALTTPIGHAVEQG
jgi:type VI secretion system ImpC/EvpB family protein